MILKKNHKIPLDKFINYCLYDKKNGYYMNKNPFGIKGDFTTAPNISRLFSEMIAVWIVSFWESLGSPKKFNLIELGAGNGEMMKIMIESFKKFPSFISSCNIIIHEKSPNLIKEQKANIKFKDIKWVISLQKINSLPSIFLANEFFDALPIKQFLKDKGIWFEKFVHTSANKKLGFINKKIDIKTVEKKINFKISVKQNFIEYSPLGLRYLIDIFKLIKKNKGALLIIDYGYFAEKMKDTLQAIHKKKYSKVLENIGKSDITYNINFNLIKKISKKFKDLDVNFTSQKNFLINLGIQQRAEIISKDKTFTEKVDMFYRLKRLINEKEMGDLFKVMLIKNSSNNSQVGF
jgi:NADH dehydrogenase [ubiquinone] 1 alpha subcomplex assembly factor 7|tara:strand:- start:2524 stop:3570 length:1047 start_codon:yes stop_codon:yes gene_type:complete